MKRLYYGINDYHKEASMIIEQGPRWAFLLDDIICLFCLIVPPIPFPRISMKLKDKEDIAFFGNEKTTLKDWYGDLSQWFCIKCHMPVTSFCYKKINVGIVKLDYDELMNTLKKFN